MAGDRARLSLRAMTVDDLATVAGWLSEAHVARWYVAGSSAADELDDLRQSLTRQQPVEVLVVLEDSLPVGWCQWYRCDDDPEWAADVDARPGDVGIDYAIGDPAAIGRGLGTVLIAALISHVRERHPAAGVVADPEAANAASRRVLEKNGFELVAQRVLPSESTHDLMAVYRLPPPHVDRALLGQPRHREPAEMAGSVDADAGPS